MVTHTKQILCAVTIATGGEYLFSIIHKIVLTTDFCSCVDWSSAMSSSSEMSMAGTFCADEPLL